MEETAGHLAGATAEPSDADRHGSVLEGPIAELAEVIPSPTPHRTSLGYRAGMELAGGNRNYACPKRRHVNLSQPCVERRPCAELAERIASPTLHAATRGQGAGMGATSGNLPDTTGKSSDIDRLGAVRTRAIAQLAAGVLAPALHRSPNGQRAGVATSRSDLLHIAQRGQHLSASSSDDQPKGTAAENPCGHPVSPGACGVPRERSRHQAACMHNVCLWMPCRASGLRRHQRDR